MSTIAKLQWYCFTHAGSIYHQQNCTFQFSFPALSFSLRKTIGSLYFTHCFLCYLCYYVSYLKSSQWEEKKQEKEERVTKSRAKAEAIDKAVAHCKREPDLSFNKASVIYGCSKQSISNHFNTNSSFKHFPDVYINLQRLTPAEEAALVKYINECYLSGFPLHVPHVNNFANEILRNRGDMVPVSVNWHLNFFDNCIILLYLPPHTTHKLQPLDVGQFGPLAQYYGQFVEDHVQYGFDISKREYTSWILQACKKANSESNILLAFRRTGLILFNSNLVLQSLKHPQKWPGSQSDDPME